MIRNLFLITICLFLPAIIWSQKGVITSTTAEGSKILDTLKINETERWALVIGNEDYQQGKLKNPVNDAKGIEKLLKKYGFRVMVRMNLNIKEMEQAVMNFSDSVSRKRGIGLFYFSGHGVQHNSRNFLLPLDCQLKTEEDIEKETLQLDTILKKISFSRNGMNIVILDACRNSPFYAMLKNIPRGLTYSLDKIRNTLIFFATSANDVAEDGSGENSPFTTAFINVINRSDSIELMQIAKQVVREVEERTHERQTPQYVGTVSKDFFFMKTEEKRRPQVFVLSVGISRYRDAPPLRLGSSGAKDFAEAFKLNPALAYDASNAYYLLDQEASKFNIMRIINQVKKRANPGDLVILYYSGHLMRSGPFTYLLPYDADFENPQYSGIMDAELLSILSGLPCKSLLFLDGAASGKEENSGFIDELLKPRNNVVVFTSSGQPEKPAGPDARSSIFTAAIIRGLREAESRDNPGFVDILSLSEYVKQMVTKNGGGRQVPVTYFPLGWQNFILTGIPSKPAEKN